jgi:flagellin
MTSVNYNAPAAMNVSRLNHLERGLMRSMQRVSSGERITRAADDVSAHSISEQLRSQIRSKAVAARNVQDGIALINVAEGALNEVDAILHRMRELTVQSANGTLTDKEREYIAMEVKSLKDEINYISNSTHYNGQKLLNGTGDWGGTEKGGFFQIGSYNAPNIDSISHRIPTVNTRTLGIDYDEMDVSTIEGAQEAIDMVKNAVEYVNDVRANLGGIANRLEHSWRNIEKMIEDNQSYESLLRDTDIGEEMITVTRDQIIHQYATAMLAQANQTPQTILQLLR